MLLFPFHRPVPSGVAMPFCLPSGLVGVCRSFVAAAVLALCIGSLLVTPVQAQTGPVPDSAANRNFEAGFTAAMMLKDLKLAQAAAQTANTATPMGAAAAAMFGLFCGAGNEKLDYSGIINMIRGK